MARGDPGTDALFLPAQIEVRPPPNLGNRLREELHALHDVPGFLAAAISRRDGLTIQHTFRSATEAARLCAMAAAMVGASKATGAELSQGGFQYGLVRYDDGILIVSEAGPEALVACLLRPDTNLGMALLQIGRAAEGVIDVLEAL